MLNWAAREHLYPTLTLLLDTAPELRSSTLGIGASYCEGAPELPFHGTEGYWVQARKQARRIKVIDAVRPADSVLQAAWKEMERVLLESGL